MKLETQAAKKYTQFVVRSLEGDTLDTHLVLDQLLDGWSEKDILILDSQSYVITSKFGHVSFDRQSMLVGYVLVSMDDLRQADTTGE